MKVYVAIAETIRGHQRMLICKDEETAKAAASSQLKQWLNECGWSIEDWAWRQDEDRLIVGNVMADIIIKPHDVIGS